MKPHWTQPSHPDAIEVISQPGSFASFSRAASSFGPGDLLARLSAPTLTLADRAYSSVQVGSTENIELNCDFLYINHSCEPNLEFHVLGSDDLSAAPNATSEKQHPIVIEIRAAGRTNAQGHKIGIKKGDELSFFYPSTEWDMDQPFDCNCNTPSCQGLIRGTKHMNRDNMKKYFINEHILRLKEAQENGGSSSGSGRTDGSSSPA